MNINESQRSQDRELLSQRSQEREFLRQGVNQTTQRYEVNNLREDVFNLHERDTIGDEMICFLTPMMTPFAPFYVLNRFFNR